VIVSSGEPLFEEHVGARGRAWWWLPVLVVVTFFAIAPFVVPFVVIAWFVNYFRYRSISVRIDPDYLWVGTRRVRLAALDLSTLGRASNPWPWRPLNTRYLGANAFWMRDSVGVRGVDRGKKYWVSVGTGRREELIRTLNAAVPAARARTEIEGTQPSVPSALPPAGWHTDPWDPAAHLRWWDGYRWTGWTWPPVDAPPNEAAGEAAVTPGSTGPS
jgi:hypothetical protein